MMRESLRLPLVAVLLLLLGIAIYLPGLSGPLLFDDKPALTANELVQIHGGEFDEWRVAAFSSSAGPLRRPIAMLSFAANHAIAGDFSPFGLKAVNLGIHLAIAVLLSFFSSQYSTRFASGLDVPTRRLLALTAAAIWLLHPLNVSTVLYAVQRMAQLATLFVLAGLLVFMHYRQRWAEFGAATGEVLAAALWLLLLTLLRRPVQGKRRTVALAACGAGGLHLPGRVGGAAKPLARIARAGCCCCYPLRWCW